MNEQELTDALEDRAADVPVGPAPIASIDGAATRVRRRRGVLAGAAAVVALAAVTTVLVQVLPSDDGGDGAVDPAAGQRVDVPPEGYRYVALGRVAIAVPEEWPRNDVECNGVAEASTYVVDLNGPTCAMASDMPADTDAVTVLPSSFVEVPRGPLGWDEIEVDGVTAFASPITTLVPNVMGEPRVEGTVVLPELGVAVRGESTVSEERVADLLDRVVVLDEHVGVPGFSDLGLDGRADRAYVRRLEELGLEVELEPQVDKMQRASGEIISVEPEPGTVVEAGSTVRVRAAR